MRRSCAGPLPRKWIAAQAALQGRILQRMRQLGMKPVLSCFAGHVPERIGNSAHCICVSVTNEQSYHPDGRLLWSTEPCDGNAGSGGVWLADSSQLQRTSNNSEPLFQEIAREFMQVQKQEFGSSSHLYQCDPFNEMNPISNEQTALADAARAVLDGIRSVDAEGVWVMQAWTFYNDRKFWGAPQVSAFMSKVKHAVLVLDLICELDIMAFHHSSFSGAPFVYGLLHNFGGNSGMFGNLDDAVATPMMANAALGSTMVGIGLTAEAIEHNPVVYELFSDANAFPFISSPEGMYAWRIVRHRAEKNPMWDLEDVQFFADRKCVFEIRGGEAVASGSAEQCDYGPESAFDGSRTSLWGGRTETTRSGREQVWIGREWRAKQQVQCIIVRQAPSHPAAAVEIEAANPGGAWIQMHKAPLQEGTTRILLPASMQGHQLRCAVWHSTTTDAEDLSDLCGERQHTEPYVTRIPKQTKFSSVRLVAQPEAGLEMWDVELVELYSTSCEAAAAETIVELEQLIHSDSYDDTPSHAEVYKLGHAFDDRTNHFWGGRPDHQGLIWLGVSWKSSVTVGCIKIKHPPHEEITSCCCKATHVKVQAKGPKLVSGTRVNFWGDVADGYQQEETDVIWIELTNRTASRAEIQTQQGIARINLDTWLPGYTVRRYGGHCVLAVTAWNLLHEAVYRSWEYWMSMSGLIHNAPNYRQGNRIRKSQNAEKTVHAWVALLGAAAHLPRPNGPLDIDLVDVSRSVLSNFFVDLYTVHLAYFNAYRFQGDDVSASLTAIGRLMLTVIADLDTVLLSNENTLVGRWIERARAMVDEDLEDQFEFNARNLVTLWGPSGEINDYGARSWAGIVGGYYYQRWSAAIVDIDDVVSQRKEISDVFFEQLRQKMLKLGQDWMASTEKLDANSVGDTAQIVTELQERYTRVDDGFKKIVGVTAYGQGVEAIRNVNVNDGNYGYNGRKCQLWTRHAGMLSKICGVDPACVGFSSDGHLFQAIGALSSNPDVDLYLKVMQ